MNRKLELPQKSIRNQTARTKEELWRNTTSTQQCGKLRTEENEEMEASTSTSKDDDTNGSSTEEDEQMEDTTSTSEEDNADGYSVEEIESGLKS
jgi:hypothetical protein